MLKTRIFTALVGIPILLSALYLGGLVWQLLVFLLVTVALGEYLSMVRFKVGHVLYLPAYLLTYLLLLGPLWTEDLKSTLGLGLFVLIVALLLRYPDLQLDDFALSLAGAIYCGFTLSFALIMREAGQPWLYLLLALLLTWSSDVGGYAFGRLWGRNKLAPALSPSKTWEGALGAVIFSISTAMLFGLALSQLALVWWQAALIGFVASLAAQIGDLWESSIKRWAGVKDAGRILPGHGGVLDRFDSLMLVLPVMYYGLKLLGQG
ncbi:MAG: phosphatidate cytidylyltransferase [Syntrophomonadaceae bacterium]|nr:phosphatidate cytidylyltransferase [Syntrophomonadaceae bacterium]